MALALTALKLVSKDDTNQVITGTLTASGSYAGGGDTFPDLATIPQFGIFKNLNIISIQVFGQAGYQYTWVPGATSATHKMKVFIPTTPSGNNPNAEHSAAAYNAAVTGDTIKVVIFLTCAPR
jgi:hypothetical protein